MEATRAESSQLAAKGSGSERASQRMSERTRRPLRCRRRGPSTRRAASVKPRNYHTTPTSHLVNRRPCPLPILASLALLLLAAAAVPPLAPLLLARAQCPEKTMTSFERIGGVTIKDIPLTVMFSAPNASSVSLGGGGSSSASALDLSRQLMSAGQHQQQQQQHLGVYPITAECNNRCRRNAKCRAFLVDYARHTCWSVEQHGQGTSGGGLSQLARAPTPIHLAPTSERTAYFEKVCLNLPAVDCERAWIFERAIGYHLHGHDDKIIDDVPSRLRCQEHCLGERDFKCRSGEYDDETMQCRLSAADRHLKPHAYRATLGTAVNYFENQCVQVPGGQCDSFDRYDDLDLGRPEIMRIFNTSDQCQQYCTHTIKAFICRSFTWSPRTGKCYLNSANSFMVGGLERLVPAPGLVYYQRNDCIDLKLECDTTAMTLQLRTQEPFRGRMYVRDEPQACDTMARTTTNPAGSGGGSSHHQSSASLIIPFQSSVGGRCATRELPSRYSTVVVVQQHPLIQRKSDRYIKLVCDFQTSNKTITSTYNVVANPWTSTALINATSFAPKIRLRITDKYGNDITGAKLGDELQLRIEAESESVYDMVARSVLAKSGTTDESIVLIDRDGCPADYRIFPPLRKLNKRVIIGKFDAFKFSSDVVVRFQVDVQFCLNTCPPTQCQQQQPPQQLQLQLQPSVEPPAVNGFGLMNSAQQQPDSYSAGSLPTVSPMGSAAASSSSSSSSSSAAASSTSSTTTSAPAIGMAAADEQSNQAANINQQLEQFLAGGSSPSELIGGGGGRRQAQFGLSSGTRPQLIQPQLDQGGDATAQTFDSQSSLLRHHNHYQQQQQQGRYVDGAASTGGTNKSSAPAAATAAAATSDQQAGAKQEQEPGAASELGPGQNSHRVRRRRRRRSVEQIPANAGGQHVPLQREIIVVEGPTGAAAAEQAARRPPSEQSNAGRRRAADLATRPGAAAATLQAANSRPAHDQAPLHPSGDSHYYATMSGAPQDGRSAAAASQHQQQHQPPPLLCTTWSSLVFAILAFCALQLLTVGLYLATWLHRQRLARRNKAKLSFVGHHHHHHSSQQQQSPSASSAPSHRPQQSSGTTAAAAAAASGRNNFLQQQQQHPKLGLTLGERLY